MTSKSNAVAKAEGVMPARVSAGTLAIPEDMRDMFAGDAGVGSLTKDSKTDFSIPFLTVLQSLSPQVDPGSAEYLEEAKVGMIFNTLTKKLSSEITVMAVAYAQTFVEWVPRKEGGGFRGEHPGGSDSEWVEVFNRLRDQETGKAKLENGNDLVDTRNFYVLLADVDPETGARKLSPAMISMASTQTKAAKYWRSLLKDTQIPRADGIGTFTPSFWSSLYKLSSVQQSNSKGKWYGWRVERVGLVQDKQQYLLGSDFHKQISGGTVTVDRSQLDPESDAPVAGDKEI